jgi:hypothetical protein
VAVFAHPIDQTSKTGRDEDYLQFLGHYTATRGIIGEAWNSENMNTFVDRLPSTKVAREKKCKEALWLKADGHLCVWFSFAGIDVVQKPGTLLEEGYDCDIELGRGRGKRRGRKPAPHWPNKKRRPNPDAGLEGESEGTATEKKSVLQALYKTRRSCDGSSGGKRIGCKPSPHRRNKKSRRNPDVGSEGGIKGKVTEKSRRYRPTIRLEIRVMVAPAAKGEAANLPHIGQKRRFGGIERQGWGGKSRLRLLKRGLCH